MPAILKAIATLLKVLNFIKLKSNMAYSHCWDLKIEVLKSARIQYLNVQTFRLVENRHYV